MNRTYGIFARYYDALTEDVPYRDWAEYIDRLFVRFGKRPELILEAACGTGSLTAELAKRGYDIVAADMSAEMLAEAVKKARGLKKKPQFVRQKTEELDLYGTVQGAVCALDSVNYLATEGRLARAFSRIGLFLEPGGLFIFDVNTEKKLRRIAKNAYVREKDGLVLVWRSAWNGARRQCRFYLDFFIERKDGSYERKTEVHTEAAFSLAQLDSALKAGGMRRVAALEELKLEKYSGGDRMFIVARKEK